MQEEDDSSYEGFKDEDEVFSARTSDHGSIMRGEVTAPNELILNKNRRSTSVLS
jgi:hypothetical protein